MNTDDGPTFALLDKAIEMAGKSASRFKIGAVLGNGKRPIKIGHNQDKSHPALKRLGYPDHANIHAEFHVLYRLDPEVTKGLTLYVARKMKSGGLGLAKPCEHCMRLIEERKIRTIIYTTNMGARILELK